MNVTVDCLQKALEDCYGYRFGPNSKWLDWPWDGTFGLVGSMALT
jgi:hypothetical protein